MALTAQASSSSSSTTSGGSNNNYNSTSTTSAGYNDTPHPIVPAWNDTRSDTAEDSLEAEYGLDPHLLVSVPDVTKDEDNNNKQQHRGTNRQIGGAAIAAGVAGTLLLGPAVGVLVGVGAAGGAALGKGRGGDMARSSGEVVASAGDRIKNFDQKHQVTAKASKGFIKGANWVSNKLKVKKKDNVRDNLTN